MTEARRGRRNSSRSQPVRPRRAPFRIQGLADYPKGRFASSSKIRLVLARRDRFEYVLLGHTSVPTDELALRSLATIKIDGSSPPVTRLGGSMRSAILCRLVRFCVGAPLVLLTWAAVDSGQVLADCRSHDIPAIPLSQGSVIGFQSLDRAGERALADLTEIPGRPRPCTGPMCSGRPSIPLAPSIPDIQRITSWAILQATVPFLTTDQSESCLDDEEACLTHTAGSIFHPPRLSSPLLTS
jgi:hypothetical protein